MPPSSYRFYYHTISFHYLCRRFSWVKMSDRVKCKVLLGIVAIKAPRRMFWSCLATFAATNRILEAAWLPNSACTPVHFYNNKWTLWFLTFWSVLRSKLQAPVVSFNPSKTESIVISRKRNKPLHPRLLMDNTVVKEVDKHKHLGIVCSNDCNWHAHILAIANKAWQRIKILRAF